MTPEQEFNQWYEESIPYEWMTWEDYVDDLAMEAVRYAERGYERMVDAWASMRSLCEPAWAQ